MMQDHASGAETLPVRIGGNFTSKAGHGSVIGIVKQLCCFQAFFTGRWLTGEGEVFQGHAQAVRHRKPSFRHSPSGDTAAL